MLAKLLPVELLLTDSVLFLSYFLHGTHTHLSQVPYNNKLSLYNEIASIPSGIKLSFAFS